jgi:hypothetical protein
MFNSMSEWLATAATISRRLTVSGRACPVRGLNASTRTMANMLEYNNSIDQPCRAAWYDKEGTKGGLKSAVLIDRSK